MQQDNILYEFVSDSEVSQNEFCFPIDGKMDVSENNANFVPEIVNNKINIEKPKPFNLVSWFPLMVVKNNVDNDTCDLCRNFLFEKCIECSNKKPYDPNIVCKIDYNTNCIHAYHKHCIQGWTKKNNTCPTDMKPWTSCNKKNTSTKDKNSTKTDKEKPKSKAKKELPKLLLNSIKSLYKQKNGATVLPPKDGFKAKDSDMSDTEPKSSKKTDSDDSGDY